jgi:lysophospholipase L1-like esterase
MNPSMSDNHLNRPRALLKNFIFTLAPTCFLILFLEVFLRVAAFLWFDYSEYYLYYGFHNLAGKVGISPWQVYNGEYYKFPPNYVLRGKAGQGAETASINSLGFRGPEFQATKPQNVFRVICLGESSTFGYHDSDTGTYPFQLEQLFKGYSGNRRVEVINAGFPYYNTGSIVSLLEKELLSYQPDLLTLYSGFNDVGWPFTVGSLSQAVFWLQGHSIIYLIMKETILTDQLILRVKGQIEKRIPRKLDTTAIEDQTNQVVTRYQNNVKRIIAIAKRNNIPVILIKQPMTTQFVAHENQRYISYSYEEEYQAVLQKFREQAYLYPGELTLVTHHRLMEELEHIARDEKLPLVDNIAIVDQDRSRLTTWVHLTEEANLRLAEALKGAIEPYLLAATKVATALHQ